MRDIARITIPLRMLCRSCLACFERQDDPDRSGSCNNFRALRKFCAVQKSPLIIMLRCTDYLSETFALESKMAEPEALGVAIRKLWMADSQAFQDHLLRLDAPSRRMRFGMGASDEFVRGYAARAMHMDGVSFGSFVDQTLRAVAELRPFGPLLPRQAEAAFSVEAAFQDSGVGTELMGRVILAARNRGIKTLHMNCLAENRRMQRIARKYDAVLRFDMGSVAGELTPDMPTPYSLWAEAVQDGAGFVMAVLDLRSGRVKAA